MCQKKLSGPLGLRESMDTHRCISSEILFAIPIKMAAICCNCEQVVSMGPGSQCPACGSRSLITLSTILDREETYESEQLQAK
jgi:rRNA maturation endonuclease Nob1